MKKYNLLLCGLIAMLFSACTKDELAEINSQPLGEMVSVTAYAAGSGENTRVSYTDKDGSYTLAWEDEESFSVIRGGDNKTFSKTTPGNTFTGVLPGGDGTYYAVYPTTAATSLYEVPYNLTTQKGVLDSEKTLMYASSADGTKFKFHHSTAILKVTFSGLPDNAKIKNVAVTTAEANLTGTHDLTNGKLTSDSKNQQITITFDEAIDAATTPVFIYLPPMAADKKSLTFHVTTSNGVYAASLAGSGGKAIEAGKIYDATVAVGEKVNAYLTFEADKDGMQLKLDDHDTRFLSSKGSDNKNRVFQYSTNGTNWTTITKDTGLISFVNKKLYLRGQSIDGTWQLGDDYKYLQIKLSDKNSDDTNKVSCTGDIRTLVDHTKFATVSTDNARFRYLFSGCSALKKAPELPATKLAVKCYLQMFSGCTSLTTAPAVLPATTLSANCYEKMFTGCSSLVTAPELPATTLAANCYQEMFFGCSSLATAPALPATKLAVKCYQQMFQKCTSLTTAPALPATTLAESCYYMMFQSCSELVNVPANLPAETLTSMCYSNMFYECTSLVNAPALSATTLANFCCSNMFNGCTSLVNAPELPATTLANNCYVSMFKNCSALETAPELPATTLADYCYQSMFNGCSSLNKVTMLATNIGANSCFSDWVKGVAATGTFIKAAEMKTLPTGNSGIPNGWTVDDYKASSYLTFTAAEDGQNMIITAKNNILLSKGSDGNDRVFEYSTNGTDWKTIYNKLGESIAFENKKLYLRGKSIDGTATSETEYLKIGFTNTENKVSCSGDIRSLIDYENFETVSTAKAKFINLFTECKTLKGAPELPATTLAEKCYKQMFYGCKSLVNAPELPATTLASNCYYGMFDGCSSLATAPSALPATTLVTECYKYMFYGCKALETAPELPATTLARSCYQSMFSGCSSLNKVTMLATNIGAQFCLDSWLNGVAATGTFIKAAEMNNLTPGSYGIPSDWTVKNYGE